MSEILVKPTVERFQPKEPMSWHDFSEEEFLGGDRVSMAIGGRVRRIIGFALRAKMSRGIGWKLRSEDDDLVEDFLLAASIYKRGVWARVNKTLYSPIAQMSGDYRVVLSSQVDVLITLKKYAGPETIFFIDSVFDAHWKLAGGLSNAFLLEVQESCKNYDLVERIHTEIKMQKNVQNIVVLGGGLLCDAIGFVAALERKKVVLCPTTLLAAIDSSIGGKTGVNVDGFGKNLVGSFNSPIHVHICASWFASLPEWEFRSGLGEAVKHALIAGRWDLFERLLVGFNGPTVLDSELLLELISIKAKIVEEDPFEQGKRVLLNFGHTLGHAMEALFASSKLSPVFTHGEGVILGMRFSLFLSEVKGLIPHQTAVSLNQKITSRFCSRPLKVFLEEASQSAPDSLWGELWKLIKNDKKATSTEPQWVLLKDKDGVLSVSAPLLLPASQSELKKAWALFWANSPQSLG
jgi:3-dehydroquinate synthetase